MEEMKWRSPRLLPDESLFQGYHPEFLLDTADST